MNEHPNCNLTSYVTLNKQIFCLFYASVLQTEARETISRMLAELDLGRTEKCVRVNSVSSGLSEADLQVILQAEVLPPAIMLPKVEDTDEVKWVMYKF